MFTTTKIALATAFVLSSGVAALAASDASEERGGYVIEGSMVGVNPVYHPDIFGNGNGQMTTQTLQQDRSERGKASNRR
jgi:hypothetical protein